MSLFIEIPWVRDDATANALALTEAMLGQYRATHGVWVGRVLVMPGGSVLGSAGDVQVIGDGNISTRLYGRIQLLSSRDCDDDKAFLFAWVPWRQ